MSITAIPARLIIIKMEKFANSARLTDRVIRDEPDAFLNGYERLRNKYSSIHYHARRRYFTSFLDALTLVC